MAQSNVATNVGSVLGGLAGTAIGGPVGGIAGQALGSVAGGLISAAPTLIKSQEQKYNEQRLKDLKRRQDLGLLGLTEEEKQQLYAQQDAAAQKAQQDIKDLQSGVAASLATGAGAASRTFAAEQEAMIKARAAAERAVMAQNIEEKKAQLAEIEKRTQVSDQFKKEKQAAIAGVAMTGIGALDESIAKVQAVRGVKPTPEQIQQFMKYTGLNEQQTVDIIGRIARDPAAASIYGGIVGDNAAARTANTDERTTKIENAINEDEKEKDRLLKPKLDPVARKAMIDNLVDASGNHLDEKEKEFLLGIGWEGGEVVINGVEYKGTK